MQETSFGRFQLRELLGRGGMGHVYRAFDTETDRVVAVKVLPPHLAEDPEYQRRFRREARTAAALADPHVVPIHGYGEIDGRLYVDMRLIEGLDLSQVITAAGGRLPAARAVGIIEQVAAALNSAHRADLMHRDIKPSNILVTDRDFTYLIDFGISRTTNDTVLTKTGLTVGTFAYMAPERFRGETEIRSDVYALACVLFESLTGRRPFVGETLEQQLTAHLTTPAPRPSAFGVPPAFDAVIAKGMAKDPHQRYQSALELTDAARAALVAPRPVSPKAPPARPPVATTRRVTPPAERAATVVKPGGERRNAPSEAVLNQRRREAAKLKLERELERRAEEEQRTRKMTAIIIGSAVAGLVVIIGAVALTGDDTDTPATTRTASAPPTGGPGQLPAFAPPAGLGSCEYSPSAGPASKEVQPPKTNDGKVPTDPASVSISMITDQGPIGLLLDNAKAPCTVNNFVSLAEQKYFDNTACHRLTTATLLHVLQCGDPTGDGTGGPGYQFANEYPTDQYPPNDPAAQQPLTYPRGTLAMANAGPGTNGSQFFLVYQDSQLPPQYTVFGTVDDVGLTTLDHIAAGGVAPSGHNADDGAPNTPVTITSTRLD